METNKKKFMMVFFGNEDLTSPNTQERMQKWGQWFQELGQSGRLAGGEALTPNPGKRIIGKNKQVKDGPFAESKEIISGFGIILAENLEEAIEIAKGCPVYDIDGSLEVREVMDTGN
jgi:hypothetical protein